MQRELFAAVLVAFCSSKVDGSCPALPSLRTTKVSQTFDPAGLAGLWYEWAYADVAQVGASCQTLNSTLPGADGVIDMAFRVDYAGKLPFTIVEIYSPTTDGNVSGNRGLYIKRAKAPGSKLVELPTVFVDVTSPTAAATSSASTTYDTMTIYSCVEKLGVTVTELILAGRTPAPPDPTSVEHMAQLARSQGAMWDPSAFHTVNRTNCK